VTYRPVVKDIFYLTCNNHVYNINNIKIPSFNISPFHLPVSYNLTFVDEKQWTSQFQYLQHESTFLY